MVNLLLKDMLSRQKYEGTVQMMTCSVDMLSRQKYEGTVQMMSPCNHQSLETLLYFDSRNGMFLRPHLLFPISLQCG